MTSRSFLPLLAAMAAGAGSGNCQCGGGGPGDGGPWEGTDSAADCGCPEDSNECTLDYCIDGKCEHPPDFDFNGCTGGVCLGGACCTGCWNGAGCRPGTERTACGAGGGMCALCPMDDGCMVYRCEGWCLGEIVDAPGCPACGAFDEPCCQDMACDPGLACQFGLCGKDCFEWRCYP